jgi:hypothetical protein
VLRLYGRSTSHTDFYLIDFCLRGREIKLQDKDDE